MLELLLRGRLWVRLKARSFKKEIYLFIDRIYEVFNGVPFALNFRRNSLAAGGLDRNFGGKRFYK